MRFLSLLIVSYLYSLSALAAPPSTLESVCDSETGAAFGLCTAYCVAMDCDSETPMAAEAACQSVGIKFEQLTGKIPPCEISCPCEAFQAWKDVVNDEFSICGTYTQDIQYWMFITGHLALTGEDHSGAYCGLLAEGGFSIDIEPSELTACNDYILEVAETRDIECPYGLPF